MTVRRNGPSARTWLLAALELIGALVLARIIVWTDRPAPHSNHHGMAPMPGMADSPALNLHWSWIVYAAGAVAAVMAVWWLLRRNVVTAVVCAIAMTICAVSYPLRVLAAQSHLVAMLLLEVLMVLVPLLVLTALPSPRSTACRGGWLTLVIGSALAYSALLIVIHIPAVHHSGVESGAAPWWLLPVAPLIGLGYWYGVLRTTAVVHTRTRRASLLGAQEVAAFVGLLSLFGAWGATTHTSPMGIPEAWDQRLGGLVMMATCAAVAIPIVRRMDASAVR
jgi:hypothetical protein